MEAGLRDRVQEGNSAALRVLCDASEPPPSVLFAFMNATTDSVPCIPVRSAGAIDSTAVSRNGRCYLAAVLSWREERG